MKKVYRIKNKAFDVARQTHTHLHTRLKYYLTEEEKN